MDGPRIEITPAPSPRGGGRRRSAARRKAPPTWVASAAVALMALAVLGWKLWPRSSPPAAPAAPSASPSPTAEDRPTPAAPATAAEPAAPVATFAERLVADDGATLWASPTAGPPWSLDYVPAGAQVMLCLRPRALLAHPEGPRWLAAMGPWGEAAGARLEEELGAPWAEFESLLVALTPDRDDVWHATYRATPAVPWTAEQFAQQFAAAQAQGDAPLLRTAGSRSWLLVDGGRTLVACPADLAEELAATEGAPPPLTPSVEQLAERLDAERTCSALILPRALEASGGALFGAGGAAVHDALAWLAGREATGWAVSFDLQDHLFWEIRAVTRPTDPPQRYAQQLLERLSAAPQRLEDFVFARTWPAYGRRVIGRWPSMVRTAAAYARRGVDQRQAVIRGYLPPEALHNLTLGAELVLTLRDIDEAAPTTTSPAADAASEASLAARLQRTSSLVFAKDTLQRAVELVAEDLDAPIEILGNDLQLEGITKNQSFGLDLRDRPLGEILLEILLRANPDRTATGPADPRQKLVYAIRSDPAQGGAERIVITTRSAAEKRGEALPAVFSAPAP